MARRRVGIDGGREGVAMRPHRILAIAAFAVALASAALFVGCVPRKAAPATPDKKEAAVKKSSRNSITYFGRSSVKIVNAAGVVAYIDPFAPGDYSEPADFILVTHGHSDHNRVGLVTKKEGCVILAPAGAVSATGLSKVAEGQSLSFGSGDAALNVLVVPAYNANHHRDASVGYLLDFAGMKIYHAGDTSFIPEMAALAAQGVAYALMPCDGYYNMGPAEFAKCVAAIRPRFALPMHSSAEGLFDPANAGATGLANAVVLKPGEELALKP
jgi:L-ascorbate metabolism protein UlaG (beta-lactamase superfamily)